MSKELTYGQLSILQSLLDGDDPLLRAPDEALIFYERDLAHLSSLGLLERSGRCLRLTRGGHGALQSRALAALHGAAGRRGDEPAANPQRGSFVP